MVLAVGGPYPLLPPRCDVNKNGRTKGLQYKDKRIWQNMPIDSWSYEFLQAILFRGFLTLKDMQMFEMASFKWYIFTICRNKESKHLFGFFSSSEMVYNFSSAPRRKFSLLKGSWFSTRKIYGVNKVIKIENFDDASCRLGRDILMNNSAILKLNITNSFNFFPCDDEDGTLSTVINNSRHTLQEMCFNLVPHLCNDVFGNWKRMDNMQVLKIVNCRDVDGLDANIFTLFDSCPNLHTFHLILCDDHMKRKSSILYSEEFQSVMFKKTSHFLFRDKFEGKLHQLCLSDFLYDYEERWFCNHYVACRTFSRVKDYYDFHREMNLYS